MAARGISFAAAIPFRIYDATLYQNKPPSTVLGLNRLVLIDTHDVFLTNETSGPPDKARLLKKVLEGGSSDLVVLDFEQWPTSGSSVTVASTISKFRTTIGWLREAIPEGTALGLYSTVPRRDYWRAISHDSSAYAAWQKENDQLKDLAALVDVLLPCAYTFYPDVQAWKRYARAQIDESRRLRPDAPVLLFLWPEYHDSTARRDKFLDADYWNDQLALACEHADGVVIWGGWSFEAWAPRQWDPNAAWYRAVREWKSRLATCGYQARHQ